MSRSDGLSEAEAAFRTAAREVEGEYGFARTARLPWLQCAASGGRVITLGLVPTGDGLHTRLRAPFWNEGGPTPEVAGPASQPLLAVRVTDRSPGVSYPDGVSELILEHARVVREPETLIEMIHTARTLLDRLDPEASNPDRDVEGWAAILGRPGGTRVDPWRDLVLWDGDGPRREAARRLGELGDPTAVPALSAALDDGDPGVALEAIHALASIGGATAIPPLVRRLGRRGPSVDGATVSSRSAEALRSLGQGPLVDAFADALAGDSTGLGTAVGAYRNAIIAALMDVLASFDLHARIPAARALGVLRAREALPLLREKAEGIGFRTELTEACRRAVETIERAE